jgi:hypothetical protein
LAIKSLFKSNVSSLAIVSIKTYEMLKKILAILLIFAASCKKEDNTGKICFTRTSTNLVIENQSSETYYYASFDKNILPLIFWAPFCTDNKVAPGYSINIDLNTIMGYQSSDEIVVYYWQCTGTNHNEIRFKNLSHSETACNE